MMDVDDLTARIKTNIEVLLNKEEVNKGTVNEDFIRVLASAIIYEITERGSVIFNKEEVKEIKDSSGKSCSGTLENGKIQ